jgi:DHA2 family multidrug resistance protein-like MFS transporter
MSQAQTSSASRTRAQWSVVTAFVASSAMILALGTYEFMIIPAQWDLGLSVDQANAANLIPAGAALLVVFAVSSLTDRLGYRRLLLLGAVCFAAGALLVMTAPGFGLLLLGRALGGIGGVTMGVVGLALVNAAFSTTAARAKAFAAFAALLPAVSFVFPPLGAVLAETSGWRTIPLLWLALGIVAIVMTVTTVPPGVGVTSAATEENSRPELVTPLIAGLALASLTLAATVAGTSVTYALVALVVAAVAFVVLRIVRRSPRMKGLDLRLLRSPGAWLVVLAMMLLAGSNLYFFTSLLIQYRFFDPVVFVAVLLSAPEAAALAGCFVSGWAASRWGAPKTAAVWMLLAGLASFFALTVGADASIYHPVAVLCLVAFPSAAAVGPLTMTLMDLAPPGGSSAPAAIRDALQNLGGSLGGIIAGAVGLTAFVRYTTGALEDAGLPPDLAGRAANAIVDGEHVNDLAKEPWIPPDVADLIAGSREVLNLGQSVAYWGAAVTAGLMCVVGATLLFRFAARPHRQVADGVSAAT